MSFDASEDYDTPIEDGDHLALITKVVLTESKKGTPMCAVRFHMISPKDESQGQSLRDYFLLIQKPYGYGKLARLCRAVDVVGVAQDPAGLDPHDQDSLWEHLLGKPVTITTSHEVKPRNDGSGDFYSYQVEGYKAVSDKAKGALEKIGALELPDDCRTDLDGNQIGATQDGFATEEGFDESDLPF